MLCKERVLYFTQSPDGYLVFAPPSRAVFVDQIQRAIEESRTWGEFRKRMPAGEYENLFAEQFSSDPKEVAEYPELREPADDEAFPHDVPGYCDGDYPPWLAAEQDSYLPPEVLQEFGTKQASVLNGDFWQIDLAKAKAVIARLTSLGHKVERRDDLKFW